MAKPIFIIRYPDQFGMPDIGSMNDGAERKFPEYFTFAIPTDGDWKFELFTDHKINPIELEVLKKRVLRDYDVDKINLEMSEG